MFKVMGRVRGVSHVQCDGRGRGASAMFKVMAVSHVQGDDKGGRGSEGHPPCSR